MSPSIKYVAELRHVREVSLLGTANLAFWRDRLKRENLYPAEIDGKAQILIAAAAAKFRGVKFTELSFSVLVGPQAGATTQGAFLVQAFNSSRLFAFFERALFATPYRRGDCRVTASFPASIQLMKDGEVVFSASMKADSSTPRREPAHRGEDGWEGCVFLPAKQPEKGSGNLFFARIRGFTQTFPFLESTDSLIIRTSNELQILGLLFESQFAAKEWAIREDATHGKSKTYKRSDGMALELIGACTHRSAWR